MVKLTLDELVDLLRCQDGLAVSQEVFKIHQGVVASVQGAVEAKLEGKDYFLNEIDLGRRQQYVNVAQGFRVKGEDALLYVGALPINIRGEEDLALVIAGAKDKPAVDVNGYCVLTHDFFLPIGRFQDRRNRKKEYPIFAAQIDPAEKALSMYLLRLSHLQIQRDVKIAMGKTLMELEERTGKQFTDADVRLARTAAEMAANACHALYVSLLYKRATSALRN